VVVHVETLARGEEHVEVLDSYLLGPLHPLLVGNEHRQFAVILQMRELLEQDIRVRHVRHPLRVDERADLYLAYPGVGNLLYEFDLHRCGHDGIPALETISWTDLVYLEVQS